jgi:hypothetical protein
MVSVPFFNDDESDGETCAGLARGPAAYSSSMSADEEDGPRRAA